MITYGDIYESARKERYSEQLQKLNKSFIQDVASYLKEKKDVALKDDPFSESSIKTKKQLENAITLFKELMLRRRKKILNLVLIAAETGISKQDFENMLILEKDLFEEIMKGIEHSDKNLNDSLNGQKDEVLKNELVVFLERVDEFVGFDGSRIGPFEKGQIANIPKNVVEILVADNKAEIVGGKD